MKIKRFRVLVVALSCVGMVTSPMAMASAAPVSAAQVAQAPRDVSLHQGGVLVGQMLDAQGKAIAGATVQVQAAGKQVASVQTDARGQFQVTGLRGGMHEVATAGQRDVYRLWAPQTAPPAAQQGLMLVSGTDLVRGQGCGVGCGSGVNCGSACGFGGGGGGGIGNWMANHPIITAGAIATAIAVPLALSDDDDDDIPPATP